MLDIIISLPPRVYNFLLALIMSSLAVYLFMHSADIAKDNAIDELLVKQIIVGGGLVIFFFLSRLQSVIGKFLRVLAYLVVGALVFYMTADMQDKTFVMIIRVIVGLMLAFGLYGFISFLFFKNRNEDLIKNGWQIDAKYKDVNLHSAEDSTWYVMKLLGRNPETGEELIFLSESLFFNPMDKIKEDQTFKVYVDKKNPKKYCFEEGAFSDL